MSWSATELGVLERAVNQSPSVSPTRPWTLAAHGTVAELAERRDGGLERDRLLSCGAALANLELAVRALGWAADVTLFPASGPADLVARVTAAGPEDAASAEVEQYSAIFRRRSYRAPFSLHPVPEPLLGSLAAAAHGTVVRPLRAPEEFAVLAELLGHAATVLRDDRGYQRELTAWTARFPEPAQDLPALPWTGLLRGGGRLPDPAALTGRLRREGLLVVTTDGDGPLDHLRAGVALERTWLTALTRGLVGSVLVRPLHVPEVRARLRERLHLPGRPQAILRFGYAVTATPARPAAAAAVGSQ